MENSKLKIIFSLLFFAGIFFLPKISLATALSDLANSMQLGTWAELSTNGFSGSFLETTADSGPMIVYGDSAAWDPISKRFMFLGAPHYRPWKFIIYTESNNTWGSGPLPMSCMSISGACIGHGYDHNAIDPTTGDVYHRPYYSREVYRYRNGSWSAMPQIPSNIMPVVGITGGLQYFPEMGGLVYIQGADGNSGVYFFNSTTQQWSQLAQGISMGGYHNFIEYNPVHKVILFGGGSGNSDIYKLDATGKITKMRNAPTSLGIAASIIVVDPVSGKFLLFGSRNSFMYEYDITTDSWSSFSGATPPFIILDSNSYTSSIVAPVSTYGVMMFVHYEGTNSKIYLYKHSFGTPPSDTTPPSTPTNLQATPVSSSQINLAWTASTDNVGVTGYRLERCQGSSCTNFSQISTSAATSYLDTGLSANAGYRYRVSAADAAGNLSTYSSIVSATTQSAGGGGAITGLDFPSNGSGTVQFRFAGNNLINPWPATYIWRIRPRQQTGFYTTFFWGRTDGDFSYNYYGAHPYPQGGGSGTTHNWEVSIEGGDDTIDENGNSTIVVKDQWYTQALVVVAVGGNELQATFYWDLETSTNRVIQHTTNTDYQLNFPGYSPGLVFGDAPWTNIPGAGQGHEMLSGVLRGVQIYSTNLSLSDIVAESANHTSNTAQTAAGLASVWYMNQNPTPTDISDKSGKSHNPSWFGNNRPTLYMSGGSSDTIAPSVSITAPTSGSTVSGSSVTISANASDNVGVVGVQFKLDGANLGPEDTTAPYSITWNTTQTTNGSHTLTAQARDAAGNQTTSSGITVTVNNVITPPPPTGGLPMPSLQDEKNTYTKWGWTWTADKEPSAVTEPITNYSVSDPDIHGDTEGDDLWSYLNMYRRTSNSVYLNRANAWARYFKEDYGNCVGGSYADFCYDKDAYGADHMYGWGLVAFYEYNGDTTALAEAENLGAVLEGLYAPNSPFGCLPTSGCITYGLRQVGRHLLFATRLAEATGNARWIQLRDKIINIVLNSQYWDATRGMYFFGEWSTDQRLGNGAYASGSRIQSAFQITVLAEAFAHAYRTTGMAELKNRLIAMARFVDQYGLDPTYQYAGGSFGIVNGNVWHSYSATQPVTYWDPVYTTSLVNTLVYGYKYTGDQNLLNRAKYFFNRGTKGVYGSPTQRAVADNVVHHFVDTKFDSSSGYFFFDYNKGELQYTYLLFENGGNPTVVGTTDTTPPQAPSGVTIN